MVEKEIERDKEACNMKHVLPVVKVSIYFQYIKRRHYGYIYIYTTSKLIVSVCNKLEGMWKENPVTYFEVTIRYLPSETEERKSRRSLRIAGIRVKILIQYLQNTAPLNRHVNHFWMQKRVSFIRGTIFLTSTRM